MSKLITKNDLKAIFDEILPFKGDDYIHVGMTSSQSISTSVTVCNFDKNIRSNGNALTLDTQNHAVVVGSGVNLVEISGAIYITGYGTANLKNIYLYVNDTEVATALAYVSQNYISLLSPIRVIPVAQGDKITVRAKTASGTMTLGTAGTGTTDSLIVRAIR